MVSGSKNLPESTTHPPDKKYSHKNPITAILEKYLLKYFHELLAKDVTTKSLFMNSLI